MDAHTLTPGLEAVLAGELAFELPLDDQFFVSDLDVREAEAGEDHGVVVVGLGAYDLVTEDLGQGREIVTYAIVGDYRRGLGYKI